MRYLLRLGLLLSLPALLWWSDGQRLSSALAEDLPSVRIAFLRGGDVYVLDAASGVEERLTTSGGVGSPWWTDRGEALFFRTDGQTWRWRPDADPEPVSGLGMPGEWVPDGSTLALMEPPSGRWQSSPGWVETGVWLEQGGERWRVTPPEPDIRWEPLAWSPDGQRLAQLRMEFAMQTVRGAQVPAARATLWIAEGDLHAPSLRELPMPSWLQGRGGVPDAAFWSPDGRFLTLGMGPADPCASCRADGVMWHAVPVDGSAPVAFDSALARGTVAWAPDGSFVVLSAPGGRETYRHKQLVRIDPTSGARIDLSRDRGWADIQPAVSPDGRLIAFARGETIDGGSSPPQAIASRRVWVMGVDGSEPRRLTEAPGWTDEMPVWSPDGRWLIFVRWRAAGADGPAATELWAVRPDGTDSRPLVSDLQLVPGLDIGFGYYGTFGWQQVVAVAPAVGAGSAVSGLAHAGTGLTADHGLTPGTVATLVLLVMLPTFVAWRGARRAKIRQWMSVSTVERCGEGAAMIREGALMRSAVILIGLLAWAFAGVLLLGAYAQGFQTLDEFRSRGSDGYPHSWEGALAIGGIAALLAIAVSWLLPARRVRRAYLVVGTGAGCLSALSALLGVSGLVGWGLMVALPLVGVALIYVVVREWWLGPTFAAAAGALVVVGVTATHDTVTRTEPMPVSPTAAATLLPASRGPASVPQPAGGESEGIYSATRVCDKDGRSEG
jgi:hypothetical protein